MKSILLLSFLALSFLGGTGSNLAEGQFILFINNIEEGDGLIQVALFNNEDTFLRDGKECYALSLEVEVSGEKIVTLPNFPTGDYAIAVFHDLNQDGELNTNFWGIPTEPYAFSRTPESKWKKPTFQGTYVRLDSSRKEVRMELKRWKNL